jgi:hypothetical protein
MRWQQLPKIGVGSTYGVLGAVAFRDDAPVVRVLAMRASRSPVESGGDPT